MDASFLDSPFTTGTLEMYAVSLGVFIITDSLYILCSMSASYRSASESQWSEPSVAESVHPIGLLLSLYAHRKAQHGPEAHYMGGCF